MSKINDNKTFFVTGDFIPIRVAENRIDKETLMGSIDGLFKKSMDQMEEAISASKNGDIVRKASKDTNIDVNNVLLPKCFREAQDIKDDNWEKVAKSSHLNENEISDFRAVSAARSPEESNFGGRGHLSKALVSIFNPMASEEVENDKYTDVVISDAKRKKIEAETKKEKNRDWENVSPAANSKNLNPSQMGFTPSRTAWEPIPLEPVKIAEVENIKKKNAENLEAGKQAAQVKTNLDKLFASKWEKDLADNRAWEEIVHENIIKTQDRDMEISKESIKFSDDFIKPAAIVSKSSTDLIGLFKLKNDPEDYKEANIKRDVSNLKQKRNHREDDRSWETVSNAKSKKW